MRTPRTSTDPAQARRHAEVDDHCRIVAVTWPFRENAGWRWIRDRDPDEWVEAIEFDKAIREGYPHATKQCQQLHGRYFLHRGQAA